MAFWEVLYFIVLSQGWLLFVGSVLQVFCVHILVARWFCALMGFCLRRCLSLSASLLVSCAFSLAVFLVHFVPFQFVCFYFTLFFFGRIF